jgi:hypothetical protein
MCLSWRVFIIIAAKSTHPHQNTPHKSTYEETYL